MRLDYQSPESLAPVIEALLFASDEPIPAHGLRSLILGEEIVKTEVPIEPEEVPAQSAPAVSTEESSTEAVSETPADISAEETEKLLEGAEIAVGPGDMPVGIVPPSEKKRKRKQLIELVTIHVSVQHLNSLYQEQERAFRIVEIAGGYQFATRPEYSEYVVRLSKEKSRRRLSGASLETLAIIAYKQPVSKTDVENIRGVNCDEVLKSLLEKNLITITGRAEAVGRPLLYGTTPDFLRHFGLHSLSDLPRPREIEELMKEESVRATTLEEAASEFSPEGSGNDMTVDAALAVARELADREEESTGGIELDVEAMQSMNPGHPEEEESFGDSLGEEPQEFEEDDLDQISDEEIESNDIDGVEHSSLSAENDDDATDDESDEDETVEAEGSHE